MPGPTLWMPELSLGHLVKTRCLTVCPQLLTRRLERTRTTLSPGSNFLLHVDQRRANVFVPKTRACVTLLELLFVVDLSAVVLTVTVPAVVGISKNNNLNSAGRVVSNLMTIARSEAI